MIDIEYDMNRWDGFQNIPSDLAAVVDHKQLRQWDPKDLATLCVFLKYLTYFSW